jgi:hypothetical protein
VHNLHRDQQARLAATAATVGVTAGEAKVEGVEAGVGNSEGWGAAATPVVVEGVVVSRVVQEALTVGAMTERVEGHSPLVRLDRPLARPRSLVSASPTCREGAHAS